MLTAEKRASANLRRPRLRQRVARHCHTRPILNPFTLHYGPERVVGYKVFRRGLPRNSQDLWIDVSRDLLITTF